VTPSSFSEHTVTIDGREVYYRKAGSGPSVMLLHGSHRSGAVWTATLEDLASEFCVIAMDRPGYGRSCRILGEEPLPDMADIAGKFCDAVGIEKAHWIGESRGGGIAIEVAARRPDLAATLVLNAPIGLPPNELLKPPEVGQRTPWEWFADRSFSRDSDFAESIRESVLEDLALAMDYEGRRLAEVTEDYNRRGLLDDIVRLELPVLLTWGRQDPVFPVECIERFKQLLPSEPAVFLIDEGRHLAFMEFAPLFNGAVKTFLANHPL
jgi:4,5:9,10-diseco-3-hydroxy-5,9,17-trioxoandrosta-1(10),2-diene-4-oate hydrolase